MAQVAFNISVEHLDEIRQALAKFPQIVSPYLRTASQQSAFILEGLSKKKTPVDTGHLRRSINTSLGVGSLRVGAIVATGVNYAVPVHEGSKAHWTSVDNLKGWAKRHGIDPYLVQWSIAHKKRKGVPFMKDAVDDSQSRIEQVYNTQITKALLAIKNMAQ